LVKLGKSMTCGSGMVETGKGMPRWDITVEVDAMSPLVDFIDELAASDHRVFAGVSKDRRESLSTCP
jgi:hypothetical protein